MNLLEMLRSSAQGDGGKAAERMPLDTGDDGEVLYADDIVNEVKTAFACIFYDKNNV